MADHLPYRHAPDNMIDILSPEELANHSARFNQIFEETEFELNQQSETDTPIKLIKAPKPKNNEQCYAEPLYIGSGRWLMPDEGK